LLASVVEAIASVKLFGMQTPSLTLTTLVTAVLYLVAGVKGNRAYLARAVRVIGQVRELKMSEEGHLGEIVRRGGGDLNVTFLLGLAMSAVAFCVNAAVAIMLGIEMEL
jgi:hypothetical protein